MYYKLDENKNVVKSSLEEWSTFIEGGFPTNYWIVAKSDVGRYKVSTVFIGMCFDFNSFNGNPNVFETMVFDENEHGIYQTRYSTWKEAESGHQRAIEWVKNGCKDDEI